MYRFICLVSYLIRQFCLPNPFEPLGDISVLLNWVAGVVLVPVSYLMTGLYYDGGDPAEGSIKFLFVYFLNTMIILLAFRVYPVIWLMKTIGIIYLVLFFSFGIWRKLNISF